MADMTSLERCQTVLEGGTPDRVPVCLLNFMPVAAMAGLSLREYCRDGEAMAAAHIAAQKRFGHDMIDLEVGVAALAGAVGCTIGFEEDTSPPWVMAPALARIDDIDLLQPIDPHSDGMLPQMLEATRIISRELGDRVLLLSEADQGPFSLASQIVGVEAFLIAIIDPSREELVKRLLDYTTEQVITYGRALIEAGAHVTMMGESLAGPDVCAPDLYRRYALPYERRVIETLASEGKPMGMHICGDATSIIEDMVETGAPFLQVDHRIDRHVAKRAAEGRTTLVGTVDPSELLARGTPGDVRTAARSDIEILAPRGGYMLAPGCALPYHTPEANVDALVQAAQDHGRYPG
jgi:MtaA/CmuA family methyltransferase